MGETFPAPCTGNGSKGSQNYVLPRDFRGENITLAFSSCLHSLAQCCIPLALAPIAASPLTLLLSPSFPYNNP